MVIEGNGIGPELIGATLDVLQAVEESVGGFHFDLEFHEGGADLFRREGYAFSEESLQKAMLSLETGLKGLDRVKNVSKKKINKELKM